MSRNVICAQCEHFSLRDSPQAAEGIGACHGFDGHVAPAEPFVRWDARPCVLFGRAKDWQKREQWIAIRRRTEAENASAASPQPQGDANSTVELSSHAPADLKAVATS